MIFKPHDYQKRAIDFVLGHEAAGLFLDMGLGKTVITLTAVEELTFGMMEVWKTLVIAPLRVAEDTWSTEAEKWDHLKHLRISKILGDLDTRKAALEEDADIYVINRENVVWLVEYLGGAWPFDMIVIDELSSFKSSQAKRFRALRKVRPKSSRIVGLTGTPAANGLMDLWAEMYLLDQGQRLGKTITSYRANYFRPGWGNGNVVYNWRPNKTAMKEITDRISDITVSMKAKDYLQLPDMIMIETIVSLDPEASEKYKAMEKESLVEIDDEEVTALSAAATMSKLLQLANGFVYDQDKQPHGIHDAKLDALAELCEAADSPVLVFYSFTEDRDRILERFKDARVLSSEKDIKDWNAGKIPILLAHPASVGYGLNLQKGGHIIAWFGLTWSLELYAQANARLHRQGQDKPVLVYHILTKDSVDEQVLKKLKEKDITQQALIDVLKDRKRRHR